MALTAFTFSTMANNEVKENEEVVNIEVEESSTPCADQWSKDYKALRDAGYSFYTSVAIANADFEDCLDETYGS